MEQGSEIYNFIKVWLSVFAALSYCYVIGKIAPQGGPRLVSVLPVVGLFLLLPLSLSSVHLGGSSAFFIAWLANFKLLLFAFGRGPLASDPSSISLPRFIALACLPIKVQPTRRTDPSPRTASRNQENADPIQNGRVKHDPNPQKPRRGHKSPVNYGIKILLVATMLRIYDYSDRLPQKVVWFLYSCHIYFGLEIILAVAAAVARAAVGLELEPQFDEPYLSTSLQDFWGRRWNIMVSSILRPAVYEPVHAWASRAVGRRYAALPAVLGTFAVSALMHELIFYYLGRVRPTGEITWFFLFHGVCLTVEIAVKKELKLGLRLPRPVASVLTAGFVMVTAFRWFLPPLLRCRVDERAFEEYAAVGALVREVGRGLGFTLRGALNASSLLAKP
ncbi:acyl-CoA--sterol O-acyltransferase 1-like [Rhodamnia argentea]|uniref:Acyl-CoA--sterol O-acyltransferase 1-like n=1 Tax=Rhodamnia argentea TaxID=178133 RepID=A0A8B8R326_9MYRT|nr:acyl-CoA--sterol O-acyltransferase 1-like [Rhodamnia argentea]